MDGREYLCQMGNLTRKIYQLIMKQTRIQAQMYSLKSPSYDSDPVQSSHSKDKISDSICGLSEISEEIEDCKRLYTELAKDIWEQLKSVENEHYREILYKHYYEGKSIYEIAHEEWEHDVVKKPNLRLESKERSVKRAHKAALEEFAKIYEENVNLCKKCLTDTPDM